MPGQVYSAHDTVSLTGSAGATMEAYITAPATGHIKLTDVIISGDFDAATDDPIVARLVRATGVSGGTTKTASKHNTENALASQATVHMDSVTATEVSNSCVWDVYIKPSFSMKPGVMIAPGETWAVELTPGVQEREIKINMYWEE